ncbi:hypothetical protein PHMEG_00032428 [Phytophthora megakarya]|uniref:Uncharacterized protein n=1 Tax=Phytophthora megakarya TaxID=4795 RepID=A0A225UW00_9STRA|nr:hypothetical protein PHMEG_00032428 [Phytophthora megakarya]
MNIWGNQNIARRRHKRYYGIVANAAVFVETRRLENKKNHPLFLQMKKLYKTFSLSKTKYIPDYWKLKTKLKVCGYDGQKDQLSSVRMLLLVQNEVGQDVGKGLTSSKSHEESASILRSVVPKLDLQSDSPQLCMRVWRCQ